MKYLPKPWAKSPHCNLIKSGDFTVCVVMGRDDKDIESANVRLIESSPAMFEALKSIAECASLRVSNVGNPGALNELLRDIAGMANSVLPQKKGESA